MASEIDRIDITARSDARLTSNGDVMTSQPSGRILIVDDDPASLLLLSAYLADVGTEVKTVSESKLVEQAVYDFEPDLVLLDLHLPRPDGREILRRLRGARASLVFLPVIVVTADSSRVARNSALLLGADDFLTKPLERSEVVIRARNLLRTRQLCVELANMKQSIGSCRYGADTARDWGER
jgi:putative two-component system response regulator